MASDTLAVKPARRSLRSSPRALGAANSTWSAFRRAQRVALRRVSRALKVDGRPNKDP